MGSADHRAGCTVKAVTAPAPGWPGRETIPTPCKPGDGQPALQMHSREIRMKPYYKEID